MSWRMNRSFPGSKRGNSMKNQATLRHALRQNVVREHELKLHLYFSYILLNSKHNRNNYVNKSCELIFKKIETSSISIFIHWSVRVKFILTIKTKFSFIQIFYNMSSFYFCKNRDKLQLNDSNTSRWRGLYRYTPLLWHFNLPRKKPFQGNVS